MCLANRNTMTKVINNPLLVGLSGRLGRTHYYREVHGQVQMCNMPSKRKRISDKQVEQSNLFRDATNYAAQETRDPEVKALYAKSIDRRRRSAYNVALSDYLNPPVIHYIRAVGYNGAAGSIITIKATDDFRVETVSVVIYSAKGMVIEKGDAARNKRKPFMWNYRTSVENHRVKACRIKVTAKDRPGNEAVAEVVM